MAKVLYSQSTNSIHNYPRIDDEPVVGLDPDYLVLTRVYSESPTTEHSQELWTIDLPTLEYRQSWVTPPAPLIPDWTSFNATMLQNASWQNWTATLPLQLVMGIVSASTLRHAEEIQSGLAIAYQIEDPGPALKAEWQTIADQFAIPVQF